MNRQQLKENFPHTPIEMIIATDYYHNSTEIISWCKENRVIALYMGRFMLDDIWMVPDQDQRVIFMLRWS